MFEIYSVGTDVYRLHATADRALYEHRVSTESWLREKNTLPHWGIEPVSLFRLAFWSDAALEVGWSVALQKP